MILYLLSYSLLPTFLNYGTGFGFWTRTEISKFYNEPEPNLKKCSNQMYKMTFVLIVKINYNKNEINK